MQATQTTDRQSWACPFEAPASLGLRSATHCAPPTPGGYNGPPLTVCPGYSTSLPETIEIARAWSWAERGDLRAFTGDERPSEGLIDGIDVFAGAVADFHDHKCSMCDAERK